MQNCFFVYLGVIFDVEHANYLLIGTCVVILTLMFISRYVSARVLSIFKPEVKPHVTLMASMVARGFTSTFVALLPSTKGIDVPLFKEIVLAMVLFSTIVTMVGSIIYELKPHRGARTMDRNPQIEWNSVNILLVNLARALNQAIIKELHQSQSDIWESIFVKN